MSMDINSNYGSYYTNTFSETQKDNMCSSEVKAAAKNISKDNVQEYYEKLCKKFSKININTGKGVAGSSGNKIALNLSSDCLKKMASDPAFAKKIENNIAGIPAAHEQMLAKAKSDGIEIHGFAVRINADGSMQCSCSGSTRTSPGNGSSSAGKLQKRDKTEKWEKQVKKNKEKKAQQKKRAERKSKFREMGFNMKA